MGLEGLLEGVEVALAPAAVHHGAGVDHSDLVAGLLGAAVGGALVVRGTATGGKAEHGGGAEGAAAELDGVATSDVHDLPPFLPVVTGKFT